jgi:peroxiredoxin
MMFKHILLAFLSLPLLFSPAHSYNLSISGTTAYPNTLVRLLVFEDMITWQEKTIALAMTDSDGHFAISADLETEKNITLALGLERGELFVIPGKHYSVNIPQQEMSLDRSYFEKEPLHIEVLSSDDNGFARQISEINLVYNTFLLQHFNALYRRSRHDLIDSLQLELTKRIQQPASAYVDDYLGYKMAALSLASRNRSEKSVLEDYFISKPILYHNIEYMALFREIFTNSLQAMPAVSQTQIERAVTSGYEATDSLLLKDSRLAADSQLRELVLLLNVKNMLESKQFRPEAIINILDHVQENGKNSQHKTIAANIIKKHRQLAFGSQAPLFRLPSNDAQVVDLRNLADKYVLISFTKTACLVCENDLLDLDALYAVYKDRFYFLTIAMEADFEELSRFFEDNGLEWPLLNLGQHLLLLEQYQVNAIPEYIILLPGGRIGMIPAPGPDRHLESHMKRLISREE